MWRLLHDLIILVEVGRLGTCPGAVLDRVWDHLLLTGDDAPSKWAISSVALALTCISFTCHSRHLLFLPSG